MASLTKLGVQMHNTFWLIRYKLTDAWKTSPPLASAVALGITDACQRSCLGLGLCVLEKMYGAVTQLGAYARIEVTKLHNRLNYNGIRILKARS